MTVEERWKELVELARSWDEREGEGDDNETDDLLNIGRTLADAVIAFEADRVELAEVLGDA